MGVVLLEKYHHYNQTVHYNVITSNEVQGEGKEAAHSERALQSSIQ